MAIMSPRILLRGLLLISSLVALGYLVEVHGLGGFLNKEWIDTEVRNQGFAGELLFVAMGAAVTAVGLPRQVVSFLGGYAFGFLAGGLMGLAAAVLGCMGTFLYARLLGQEVVAARSPARIQKLDAFVRENPFSMTLLIRLLPVGSNLATNLAAGVSSVPGAPFVAGSAIGYIPQTAVFALIGSGINLEPGLRIGLGVALFVVSGALGIYLFRRYRHGKTLDESIERELA